MGGEARKSVYTDSFLEEKKKKGKTAEAGENQDSTLLGHHGGEAGLSTRASGGSITWCETSGRMSREQEKTLRKGDGHRGGRGRSKKGIN